MTAPRPPSRYRKRGTKTCPRCGRRITGSNAARTRRKPDGTYYVACRACKNAVQAVYDAGNAWQRWARRA